MEEAPPDIAGYTIERLLGSGGMAKVYLAIQKSFERRVALKVISRQLASNPEFGRRFLREARIVGGLSHPHIVQVYDVGECRGIYYLAMELFSGGDLRDRMRTPLGAQRALEITRQLSSALGFAHQKGFIHRDIKPDNVLFRESGEAVLTDFGIARPAHGQGDLTEITQVEAVIGSPRYMSPEQSMGYSLDQRSDIYSLGVMLYEMLAGEVPFAGRTVAELSLQRKERQVPQLPGHLGHLQPLLNRMLAYEREDRFADCAELQIAINKLLAQPPNDSRPHPPGTDDPTLVGDANPTAASRQQLWSTPWRTWLPRYTAALLFAACVAVGLAWFGWHERPRHQSADAGPEVISGSLPRQSTVLKTPPADEFFAFYDAVNAGLVDAEESFIAGYPDSVFAEILRAKLDHSGELLDATRQLADRGDARAQLVLSELYDTGWGGELNKAEALHYARQAQAGGGPFAEYHYAMLVLARAQTDAERREGLRALEQSAAGGFYLAQTILANHLLEGRLLGRDVEGGLKLLEAAGSQGDRNALFNLARILDSGLYLQQADPEKAARYFKKSAQLGKTEASDYLNVP